MLKKIKNYLLKPRRYDDAVYETNKIFLIIVVICILIFLTIAFIGCTNEQTSEQEKACVDSRLKAIHEIEIDGCTYLINGHNGAVLTHKGNCENH